MLWDVLQHTAFSTIPQRWPQQQPRLLSPAGGRHKGAEWESVTVGPRHGGYVRITLYVTIDLPSAAEQVVLYEKTPD